MKALRSNLPELLALVCLVGLTVESCAHDQALRITGESLVAAGVTFEATGAAMDAALDSKVVTVEQYRAWRAFGEKFQVAYPLASDLWSVAERTKDEKLQTSAAAAVAQLLGDLAQWQALVGVR